MGAEPSMRAVHTCTYVPQAVTIRGGRREIVGTAPMCLCVGKGEHTPNKNQHGERRASGEALLRLECCCNVRKPR